MAARGLAAAKARGVGVLTGGRLTAEDSYAYAKFARVALGTNDIDFRARPHSAEEAAFLASEVVLRGPDNGAVTYTDLETASSVILVGLEPEDEAGTVFLRLRKAARGRTGGAVYSLAPYTSRGLHKMSGTLIPTRPGDEVAVLDGLAHRQDVPLDKRSVLLVGERAASVPGALAAVAKLAATTGARVAWIPRRAGDRGAVETGALPNLLPGGRPVAEAQARVDLATAWGVDHLPDAVGRDTDAIIEAARTGELGGLVVAGVDLDDLSQPDAAREAVERAGFVVALEVRESEVTRAADVVFPVAPVTDRPGTFVNWEGRVRQFGKVLHNPASLPDLRVLAGIAEELGTGLLAGPRLPHHRAGVGGDGRGRAVGRRAGLVRRVDRPRRVGPGRHPGRRCRPGAGVVEAAARRRTDAGRRRGDAADRAQAGAAGRRGHPRQPRPRRR